LERYRTDSDEAPGDRLCGDRTGLRPYPFVSGDDYNLHPIKKITCIRPVGVVFMKSSGGESFATLTPRQSRPWGSRRECREVKAVTEESENRFHDRIVGIARNESVESESIR
jgi:hypothetical protein